VFCAGADISEVFELSRDPAWRQANQAAVRSAMTALAEAPIPTLALIEGDCIGGGCGLALACDLRIGGPSARFGITPAKLGLVYSLEDTRRLVLTVGAAQARRILFTASLLDPDEAARIGLATILADDPIAEVEAIVAALLATSGHSQREAKAMIARVEAGQFADDAATLALFEQAFSRPDFAEGSAAFLERRQATFE
jgi:enoyl-CoA hydratase/carnithine racemase